MGKYFKHTVVGFTLLIGLCLSLSTLHHHERFTFGPKDPGVQLEHTLSPDITLCPLCGYLISTDVPDHSFDELHVDAHAVITLEDQGVIVNKSAGQPSKRAPPFCG